MWRLHSTPAQTASESGKPKALSYSSCIISDEDSLTRTHQQTKLPLVKDRSTMCVELALSVEQNLAFTLSGVADGASLSRSPLALRMLFGR